MILEHTQNSRKKQPQKIAIKTTTTTATTVTTATTTTTPPQSSQQLYINQRFRFVIVQLIIKGLIKTKPVRINKPSNTDNPRRVKIDRTPNCLYDCPATNCRLNIVLSDEYKQCKQYSIHQSIYETHIKCSPETSTPAPLIGILYKLARFQ